MAKQNKINPFLKFRFGLPERVAIYKKLMSFIQEEFPLYDSLLRFKKRYEKKKDFRAKIIAEWLNKISKGAKFSDAIKGWVPESELNLIAAGEMGKGLDVGLSEAIKFAGSAKKIKSAIISGATYPSVLLLVVMGFISMFSVQMAPAYLSILPLERWPGLGQFLYGLSKFIVSYWYVMFGGLAVASVIIANTIGIWTGKIRELFDKVPPWSVYKVYQACSFLISLASMMQSGIPLNDALKKIKGSSAPWLGEYIELMLKNLRKGGKTFGQHLDVGLLDDETAADVIDYSELGKFEVAIYSIGEQNLETSVALIESRMALIKNAMLVVVGVTVGMIYYTNIELNTKVADAAAASAGKSK